MTPFRLLCLLGALVLPAGAAAADRQPDPGRDILVTLENGGATPVSSGISAPYRQRKRYATSLEVRFLAAEIAGDYALLEIERWPIRSLDVLCIVFRVADAAERDAVLARLRQDPRIDSAQPLQRFNTRAQPTAVYDDTYARLQRGLSLMGVPAAHRYSRGRGILIAVVDSAADARHEDLEGRVAAVHDFTDRRAARNPEHGTAVASVIGASSNNARGIVGIAPEADIEVYAACWAEPAATQAVCDSFTLAKAFDALAAGGGADIVNISLSGPYDPLLKRLLVRIAGAGTVIVAARPEAGRESGHFPANDETVISVTSGDGPALLRPVALRGDRMPHPVHAPGRQVVVAIPENRYDFRSGSSLAAAHVSGVVALLLSVAPELSRETVLDHLRRSEQLAPDGVRSVHACAVLRLHDAATSCP